MCLAGAAASHRQIFMYNLLTTELRQITNSALGDSVQPSFNRTGGMMVFQSTAPLTGFPNPAGVPQVFVVKLNFVGNPQLPGPIFKQLSVGPSPANVIGLGPSINPILNENGTGIAFQSRSDFLGGGGDTGIYQIYYVDFDKDTFNVRTLFRITNGNASSETPHLGFTKVPDPQPGADNKRKVLLFDSARHEPARRAAGRPGPEDLRGRDLGSERRQRARPETRRAVNGQPNTACVHNITTVVFGNCTHPVVDPSGSRLGFTCDGDPLRNGSTGNQAFALTRQNAQLYQITGAGEVVGPISNSIGQWFMTLATTSDLTQGGSCGTQLYVVDFTAGKWVAATGLGQLPPDVIPQGPTTRIGQRNFSILPGGAAAGGSDTAVTTRDGTTTTPVATTKSPIDQGNISMIIGAPDPFLFEATIDILQNRIKLPPVRTPFGAVCITPTGAGVGDLDCDGGKEGGDYVIAKDHFTDDSDPTVRAGVPREHHVPDSYVAPWQYVDALSLLRLPRPDDPRSAAAGHRHVLRRTERRAPLPVGRCVSRRPHLHQRPDVAVGLPGLAHGRRPGDVPRRRRAHELPGAAHPVGCGWPGSRVLLGRRHVHQHAADRYAAVPDDGVGNRHHQDRTRRPVS